MISRNRYTRQRQVSQKHPPAFGRKPDQKHVAQFEEKEDKIYEEVTNTVHVDDLEDFLTFLEQEINFKLAYGYSVRQVGLIILHYMLFHDQYTTHDMNYEFGLPANGFTRLLKQVSKTIEEYNKTEIKWGSINDRIDAAKRGMPVELQDPLPTFIIDGTHIPVRYGDPILHFGMAGDSKYSYKFQRAAVNIQVAINGVMRVIWTDKGQPGGVHDMRAVWRSDLELIVDHIRDIGQGDLGYMNNRLNFLILTPYKNPPNGELTARQKRWNTIFNGKRVDIEQFFGLLKLRFPMFRCGYRGPLEYLCVLFRLACALTNKSLDRNRLTDIERRNALMVERQLNREYKDKAFALVGDEANLPEFERRERHGRVVYHYTRQDEEWEAMSERRSNPALAQAKADRILERRREREQEELAFYEERRLVIAQFRAEAQRLSLARVPQQNEFSIALASNDE